MATASKMMPAMKGRIRCGQGREYRGAAPVMLPRKKENDAHTLTATATAHMCLYGYEFVDSAHTSGRKPNGAGVPSMGWMKQRRRPDARTAVNRRQLRSSRNCRALGLVVHSPVDALWGRSPRIAARCDSPVIQRLFRLAGVFGIWIRIDERLKRRVRGTKAVLLHVKHCPLEEQRRRLLEIREGFVLTFGLNESNSVDS